MRKRCEFCSDPRWLKDDRCTKCGKWQFKRVGTSPWQRFWERYRPRYVNESDGDQVAKWDRMEHYV